MGMACNKVSLSDMNLSKTPSPSDLPSQLGEDVKMINEDSKCWGK